MRFCSNCGILVKRNDKSDFMNSNVIKKNKEKTVVEIFRVHSFFGIVMALNIYIDNVMVGSVSNGASKIFEIKPGFHTLKVKMNWSPASSEDISFKISEGEHFRFYCEHNLNVFEMFTNFWVIKYLFLGFNKVFKIEQRFVK